VEFADASGDDVGLDCYHVLYCTVLTALGWTGNSRLGLLGMGGPRKLQLQYQPHPWYCGISNTARS
jgi:hypothetical protein